MSIADLCRRVSSFESAAHKILGLSEAAPSRIIQLTDTYARLTALSVKQDDMLRQALRCIEVAVFRGAHVLAWAALADYLQEYAARDGFVALNKARPNWRIGSLDDLREGQTEHGLIEAMKAAGQITKGQQKAFLGLLNRRNECAHPSDYYPDLNQSLGYIAEILGRLAALQKKLAKP
jgi:hypothetical protein